jgi:hypothetical protein
MPITLSFPRRRRRTHAVPVVRPRRKAGLDETRYAAVQAWVTSRFSLDELRTLVALIQHHHRRLEAMGGEVKPDAVLHAVLADAARDPILARALKRARRLDQELSRRRAAVT